MAQNSFWRYCTIQLTFYHPSGVVYVFHLCIVKKKHNFKQAGMAKINSYLTFNGNCREAMAFYKECLGGELVLQEVGNTPMAENLPTKMKELILHAMLTNGELVIMASDMAPEQGLIKGNSVSLMLDCKSEEEARRFYGGLAAGGQATHPLQDTYWGALFGNLIDRFGIQWLLHFERNSNGNFK